MILDPWFTAIEEAQRRVERQAERMKAKESFTVDDFDELLTRYEAFVQASGEMRQMVASRN